MGNLYREGRLYTTEVIQVYDHDYAHLAEGVVIPYTIYDLAQNKAYVHLGTSKDTAEFVCDCLQHWWTHFKQKLQELVDDLGLEIRMAHHPPYYSKWNPVEHRVFPHMTRAMQGVVFTSHALVQELVETTSTKTGLQVVAHIVSKVYETGQKVADDFKDTMRILFDDHLGQWNYRAVPAPP